jgi:hypothetical protein
MPETTRTKLTKTKLTGTRTRLLLASITLLLALTVPVMAQEMKVPETAKDHHEMAERYQKAAASTREDIEMHKKMLADFNQTVVKNPKSGENPYSKNMRMHCARYIQASEALAVEDDASAKFHTLRAKELEGK